MRRFAGGLAFRVAAFLALALFPIGIIAVYLTAKIELEISRGQEAAILAMTAEAASSEESLIRGGFGALAALGASVKNTRSVPGACDRILTEFINLNPQYAFAGYIDAQGILACGSGGQGINLAENANFLAMKADPKPRSTINMNAPISKTSVISMSVPIETDGNFDGYVSLSLPHSRIFKKLEIPGAAHPLDLITFNEVGVVLSAENGLENVEDRLPRGRPLSSFAGKPSVAFSGYSNDGQPRVFAIVAILENNVYAIGSWPREQIPVTSPRSALLFPVLMWLSSFGVAYFAVHRLAITHIRQLSLDMKAFMATRRISAPVPSFGRPTEIRDIEETWHRLAETVVRDEAQLEDTIHDKTVLLKEVHHRVKNNLQLISSIVSLKTRRATTPEARVALREVQGRVMSLATVHRALFDTSTEGRIRADEVLHSICDSTIEAGLVPNVPVAIQQSYDPVALYPDQAVPLSLLASEAITNALKYIGIPSDGKASLSVKLGTVDAKTAFFEVVNSKGRMLSVSEQVEGTGLGTTLIAAFAQQAGGTLVVTDTAEIYRLRIDFPVVAFDERPIDGTVEVAP